MSITLPKYLTSNKNIFVICVIIICALYYITKPKITYKYDLFETKNHRIHIVEIQPETYNAIIVKSLDGRETARETLTSIAQRKKAIIAINGGFFEIGKDIDGTPSGTLVINDKIYNIKDYIQSVLIIEKGKIKIRTINPKEYVTDHHHISMVSGIPSLLQNNTIPEVIYNQTSKFYTDPHARTAVGIKDNGGIVLVLVEHQYKKDIDSISLGEIKSLLYNKKILIEERYKQKLQNLTLEQLQNLLNEEFRKEGPIGMTMIELAEFMQELKCSEALNLDGGGSSALWVDTKLVNKQIGDIDEANGIEISRPISDAIIFK